MTTIANNINAKTNHSWPLAKANRRKELANAHANKPVARLPPANETHEYSRQYVGSTYAERAGRWSGPHKDQFDWVLIVKSSTDNLTLMSKETVLGRFGKNRLW